MTEREFSPKEALEMAEAYGVDLSLLRERLQLSPTERLRRHQATLEFVVRLKQAGLERRARDRGTTRSTE